ncbi:hypothetical protein [Sulfobacillus harzensis]|uniref:Uncharacterized protein n=1 Tax=Sulfobacillus harzensis TaxID=2729629 RepID=A0A7Y0L6R1_9FIRM|nr:hypothetical protein [Sulfobacillus harzensis]NMP24250.1 hypothetical protein [Sulfobacillus harzensis]
MFIRPKDRHKVVVFPRQAVWAAILIVMGTTLDLAGLMVWLHPTVHLFSTEPWIGCAILGFMGLCWLAALVALALGRRRWLRWLIRPRR